MGKIKPISKFKADVKEGDLVRIITPINHETVGYFNQIDVNKRNYHAVYLTSDYPIQKDFNLTMIGYEEDSTAQYEIIRRRK